MNKSLAGRQILLVEDEMLVLMNTEDMLADFGCESVSAAATSEQALALVGAQRFDAAILDMNLNGDTSHAVADALAARGVPFLFATGYVDRDLDGIYRDRPLLTKPYRAKDLGDALIDLLAR